MTSNMIYIVALGGGFKCPRKFHLNTQYHAGKGLHSIQKEYLKPSEANSEQLETVS